MAKEKKIRTEGSTEITAGIGAALGKENLGKSLLGKLIAKITGKKQKKQRPKVKKEAITNKVKRPAKFKLRNNIENLPIPKVGLEGKSVRNLKVNSTVISGPISVPRTVLMESFKKASNENRRPSLDRKTAALRTPEKQKVQTVGKSLKL